jgi:hypothetical protein
MRNLIEQLKEAAGKHYGYGLPRADAEYYALANPANILALISELERLRNCMGLAPQYLTDFECSVDRGHLLKRVGAEKA